MPTPLTISVVIPAYNEEKLIAGCLDSLRRQSRPADEIIVVDNNSRDRTAAIAAGYPEVTVITERRQGIVFARDAGFNAARSRIIARCDADCRFPEDWLARIAADFQAHPDIAAVTGGAYARGLPRWQARLGRRLHIWTYFGLTRLFTGSTTLFGSNQAMTREIWQRVRHETCTNERHMHEDVDLAIHVARYGHIWFDPKLNVTVAARVLTEGPRKFISRLLRWPETKLIHYRWWPHHGR